MAPRMTWPCAPMLNSPARNATATPSEAMISGVAVVIVSVIGRMALPNVLAS